MTSRVGCLFVLAALTVAGCGGGSAGVSSGGGAQQVGPVSVQGDVRALAPTVSSGGATLYAMTGTINRAQMTDANPTLAETEIFYVSGKGAGIAILACSPDGKGVRTVLPNVGWAKDLRAVGDWVYFIDLAGDLRRVSRLGAANSTLVKAAVSQYAPNADDTKLICYLTPNGSWPNGRFVSCNLDGTGTAHMFASPFAFQTKDYFPGVLSDGSLVLADNQASNLTLLSPYAPSGASRQGGHAFPGTIDVMGMDSGTDLIYYEAQTWLERFHASGVGEWVRDIYFSNRTDLAISVSPDGTQIALANNALYSQYGVLTYGVPPAAFTRVTTDPATAVAWSPFIRQRTFVGSGMPFTSAGMFLFSEQGDVMPAVVWGDASTRGTIALTKVSADGAQNVVYRFSCDQVTALSYSDSLNYTPIAVPGATTAGVKGAFISFNATTGKVETITTYTGTVNATLNDRRLVVEGVSSVVHADGRVDHNPGTVVFN